MSKVAAIAVNTFKEAVRNRVLYVLLFFAILIMFGAWVAGTLSIDEQDKIVRDLGVGAINFISVLIAVFVGVGLVYNDLDKKTIYTIVSKPISRWQFLLGKYFGLLLTIAVNVLIMTWFFCAVLYFRSFVQSNVLSEALYEYQNGDPVYKGALFHLGYYIWSGIKALGLGLTFGIGGPGFVSGIFGTSLLTILEMAIITGFAVLFSSFSSPTLSAFLTVIIFIIGRLNQDLYLFGETLVQRIGGVENLSMGQTMAYYFAKGAAYLLPNLSVFDKRGALSNFQEISFGPLEFGYAIVYTALVLFVSTMIFNRKNFK